jgi:transposase-like protein
MQYSEGFKMRMVQRLSGPDPVSANKLAQEVGVSQNSLSRWLRQAANINHFENPYEEHSDMPRKRPLDLTPEQKLQIVIEAESLSDEELGEFLRRKGVHEAQLQQWRSQIMNGLCEQPIKKSKKTGSEAKKIKKLEKELQRKDKALAEASALLVLKKKAQAIWGDEDADTPKKNGK